MKKMRGIYVTDEVNRYGEVVAPEAVFGAYEKQWQEYFPSNFNHDMTIPLGYSRFDGLLFAPKIMYGLNTVTLGETDEEIRACADIGFSCQLNAELKAHKAEFDELERLLSPHLVEPKRYVFGCSALHDRDIVKRVYPELWESADGDGLIDINDLTPIGGGAYRIGEDGKFAVYPHKLFRRAFSHLNSLNLDILKRLDSLRGVGKSVRIAIDPDLIGLASACRISVEYAYWWGPKFDDDLEKIPPGVTVHANEEFDKLGGVKRTEFYWHGGGEKRAFECEEIDGAARLRRGGSRFTACRYVHSVVDKGVPVHIDGAVRVYSAEEMSARETINIDRTDRSAEYIKLWRVDGELPVALWKELLTHFYRDNTQIGEYLGGKDEVLDGIRANKAERKAEREENGRMKLDDFIPRAVLRPSEVLLKLYFSEKRESSEKGEKGEKGETEILVVPTDTYTDKDERRALFYDAATVELCKLARRSGLSVTAERAAIVSFGDCIHNFPNFVCKSVDAANKLICAIKDLLSAWENNGKRAVVTFSIEAPYPTKSVVFSFCGHSAKLCELFSNGKFEPLPTDEADVCGWCTRFYAAISDGCEKSDVDPFKSVCNDGLLHADRLPLNEKYIEGTDTDADGVFLTFKLENEVARFLSENSVGIGCAICEDEVECSECKGDYYKCGCVASVDDGVFKIVKKARIAGYYFAADIGT